MQTIEAMRFDGKNKDELEKFFGRSFDISPYQSETNPANEFTPSLLISKNNGFNKSIERVMPGDYLMKDKDGNIISVKGDVFDALYAECAIQDPKTPKPGDNIVILDGRRTFDQFGHEIICTTRESGESIRNSYKNDTPYDKGVQMGCSLLAKANDYWLNCNDANDNELNLCVLLRDHIGETFYSPMVGDVKLVTIYEDSSGNALIRTNIPHDEYDDLCFDCHGHYMTGGEMMLFPSKDQRDWNKWIEENVPTFECGINIFTKEKPDYHSKVLKTVRVPFKDKRISADAMQELLGFVHEWVEKYNINIEDDAKND